MRSNPSRLARPLLAPLLSLFLGAAWATPADPGRRAAAAHPQTFCEMAAELGYPSRGYRSFSGICASDMIDVTPTPAPNGLRNNLAFYAMSEVGQPDRLQRVSLILNVHNTREGAKAQAELARVAQALAAKILGQPLDSLESVIRQSGTMRWEVGLWMVEVRTEFWRSGLGQDTKVEFRPRPRTLPVRAVDPRQAADDAQPASRPLSRP